MSQQDRSFRKSTFGGFNRQDVAAYLQSMAREHREETDALRAAADKLRTECNTYKRQMDEQRQTQEEAALRNANLSTVVADRDRDLEALRHEVSGLGAELERTRADVLRLQSELGAARGEAQSLRDRVMDADEQAAQAARRAQSLEERLAEMAASEVELVNTRAALAEERSQSAAMSERMSAQNAALARYEAKMKEVEEEVGSLTDFKARLSEVERAAYRRAEAIETEARVNAERTGEALLKDAAEMKNRLGALRREATAAATAAITELEKARTQLEYVEAIFGGLDERLNHIIGEGKPVIRDFVPQEFN